MTLYKYDLAKLGPYVVDPAEHVGLAHYLARRYRCLHLSHADLVQEALVFICVAARTYDASLGAFSTWASCLVGFHLRAAVSANARTGRYGGSAKHRSVVRALRRRMIRPTTFAEAREVLITNAAWVECAVTDYDVACAMELADSHEVRLDDLTYDSDGDMVPVGHSIEAEPVDPDEALTMADWQRVLASVELDPREREIMERRLLADEPAYLQVIGDGWGLSRERVRQIQAELVRRLRSAAIAAGLKEATR